MTAIYVITRVITLFGAYFRKLWELLVCRVCKIAVYDERAFKYSELCGHVEHELLNENPWKSFFVCWFPFTMNYLLSTYFLLGSTYNLFYIGNTSDILAWLFLWIGISLAANCSPSFEDMLAFKDSVYGRKNIFLKIIFAPFFALICAMSCLEKYSLTFILTILYAVIFPYVYGWSLPVLSLFEQVF